MDFKRIIILALLILMPLPLSALEPPPLKGRINDTAGLLTPQAISALENKLAAFEKSTTNQVVVLTVPTLDGDDIAPFSTRVFDLWKPGQKGKDNGILIIIAKAERRVRIEVGMGLQGALPDITTSNIIRDTMRPHLKNGDFDSAIGLGIDRIIKETKGEFKATPKDAKKKASKKSNIPGKFLIILLAVALAAIALGFISRILAGAAGAVGLPIAAAFGLTGTGMMTLFFLVVGGFIGGYLLSMLVSAIMSGSGGGGYWGGWGGGFYSGGSSSSGGDTESFSGGGGESDGGGSSDDY